MIAYRRSTLLSTNVCHLMIILVILCDCTAGEPQCGKTRTRQKGTLNGKVVGGYEIGYYKYPWFAALQYEGETLCGGALIGLNVVLTAAHCFDPFVRSNRKPEDAFVVKLGVYKQCKNESTQTAYKASNVIIHDMYENDKPYYDIALMIIAGDTSKYTPICLPPNDYIQEPEGKIIGFGAMIDGGPRAYPCEMREGRVLIFNNDTCVDMIKHHTNVPRVTAFTNTFCAGYIAGGIDSCSGDSGGPLMTFNPQSNTWKTIGIVSFGWGCAKANSMGVYTEVVKYLDWIEEKSGLRWSQEEKVTSTSSPRIDPPNSFADTVIQLYDKFMSSQTSSPSDIVIQFKSKPEK